MKGEERMARASCVPVTRQLAPRVLGQADQRQRAAGVAGIRIGRRTFGALGTARSKVVTPFDCEAACSHSGCASVCADVAQAGLPVLVDRGARELVVLGIELIGLVAVDQVHDLDRLVRELRANGGHAGVLAQRGRQPGDQVGHCLLQVHVRGHGVGVHARAARVGDVLLALQGFGQRARHGAARAEQVDLQHHQRLAARMGVEHVLQRRVGDDAAVPVVLAFDVHRREARAARRRWPSRARDRCAASGCRNRSSCRCAR